jgi:hypothetical protein
MDEVISTELKVQPTSSMAAAAEAVKSPSSSSSGMTKTLSIGQNRKIKVKFSGEEEVLGTSPTGVAAEELLSKAAGW